MGHGIEFSSRGHIRMTCFSDHPSLVFYPLTGLNVWGEMGTFGGVHVVGQILP